MKICLRKIKLTLVIFSMFAVILSSCIILLGCNTDIDGVSYEDGTVIVDKNVSIYDTNGSDYKILSTTDTTIAVDKVEALSVGSVVCAGVTDTTPNGLMKKVIAIEPSASSYLLKTEDAAFTEVFKKCNFSCKAIVSEDGNHVISYHNNSDNILAKLFPQAFASPAWAQSLPIFDNPLFDISCGVEINFDLKILNGQVDTKLTTCLINDVSLKKEISTSVSRQLGLAFPDIKIEVPSPVPIIIVISSEVFINSGTIVLEQGFINCQVHLEKEVGFRYTTDSGCETIHEDRSYRVGPDLNITGDLVKIKLDPSVGLTLSAKFYGVFGLSVTPSVKDESTIKLSRVENSDGYDSWFEYNDMKFIGKVCHKITLPIVGKVVLGFKKNLIDCTLGVQYSIELFDTGDAITLYETVEDYDYDKYKIQFDTDWKKEYANYLQTFIQKISKEGFASSLPYINCALFTLNDAETPMLYIDPPYTAYGGRLVAYNDDDEFVELILSGGGGLQIVRNESQLLWNCGHMGTYQDYAYSWDKKSFTKTFDGMYGDKSGYSGSALRDDTVSNKYYINDNETTYDNYMNQLNEKFNFSRAETIGIDNSVSVIKMLSQLQGS